MFAWGKYDIYLVSNYDYEHVFNFTVSQSVNIYNIECGILELRGDNYKV